MDITQLIADDHAEQRRLFALIEELRPTESSALQATWVRLRVLLDTHALAEERFFYPELLRVGQGADYETSVDETRDAIKDHNEIRDTAAAVDFQAVGSPEWFEAVAACNRANSDHMAEEERQGLTDFRRHADRELRHRTGVQFLQFECEHLTGKGVTPIDRHVESYIIENS
ncbi:hemerythrin domain-containing protein [Sphingomonas limnosediminicola]|jgi:hypothetical protein|uniref:Hemerythrin domain-containing protein n=1 Tax=Sphingomonas limnosediminicola TaxID=940133 RepID=A0ABP7KXG2_9SPHN